WITVDPGVALERADLMFDPQTSGGLLIGIPEAQAEELIRRLASEGVAPVAEIGNVSGPDPDGHVEIV
ncbi:MAG TPA: selenide, water dikinase SelD, partial [Desulfomonilaceae bacterium]|nr:selenide, water dikinase SelD [Desulfomonilaceae bacterium]